MINFIQGVPYYMLADRCIRCEVWFPKFAVRHCPCCRGSVRHGRSRYSKGVTPHHDRPQDPYKELIEQKMDQGWTLLNQDKWNKVQAFQILEKLKPRYRGNNNNRRQQVITNI